MLFRSPSASQRIQTPSRLQPCTPQKVSQNWRGGTLAIRKSAFLAIGGFDERFVDWGGEDDEFYDRCSLLDQDSYGYLPFVHLWHPPQASKSGPARHESERLLRRVLQVPADERVASLLTLRE